jgi:hypothetical protein
MDLSSQSLVIQLPHTQLNYSMEEIHKAEARLMEVAIVNPVTANELSAFFNTACSTTSKTLGMLEYELSKCKKNYDLAKASVVLDKLPAEIIKLRDQGIKPNEDWREAFITRDEECSLWQESIEQLKAAQAFLASKLKCFERAYYSCYKEKDRKQFTPTTNITGHIGMTDNAIVGAPVDSKDLQELARLYGGLHE